MLSPRGRLAAKPSGQGSAGLVGHKSATAFIRSGFIHPLLVAEELSHPREDDHGLWVVHAQQALSRLAAVFHAAVQFCLLLLS
jgi:hypothetical protein